jgi:hypothetical protein
MLLCGGGPAHGRVEAALCAYFIVNGKGIFHAGPALIRDTAAAAEARVARTNFLRDMALRYPSKFLFASLRALRSLRWRVAGKEGA